MTTEPNAKLPVLRQCQEAIEWLRHTRRETVTCLWFFRDLFADPAAVHKDWKQVVDLMDSTFNILLRGNQLTTDVLRKLGELEGEDPTFRSVFAEKIERLEATGVRSVRTVRRFAEAVDPNFFAADARRARTPVYLTTDADGTVLQNLQGYLRELEAIIDEEERQLVDMEGFLSLRGREMEMGLTW